MELNGQYDRDEDDAKGVSVQSSGVEAAVTLSCGIADNVDLVFNMPYVWEKVEENDLDVYAEKGIGDAVLEVKMRLFEREGFSLALKPGISFPIGDEDKGLGTGKLGGHVSMIASEEIGSWAFHANVGYIRHENDADDRKDILHASIAAIWEVIKDLKLVANIGIERNPDEEANNDPVFLIGGVIYSFSENFDVDFGVKCGLTDPETDITGLAGLAFRF